MEILRQIMQLYYEINNIYLELYKLDLDGCRDSDDFQNLINILKEKLNEEERLFELLYDSNEYNNVCDYLEKEDNPMFARLLDYIKQYETLNNPIYEDDDDETIADIQMQIKTGKMYSACNKNVFLVYLSFLEECIDNNEHLRKQLLGFKYYNSFICHDVETVLINNEFSVGIENYVDLYFVARGLDIPFKLRDEIIIDTCLNTIISMIKTILSISDEERDLEDKMALSLNAECMLRACLSLLSERDYKKIIKIVLSQIDELANDENVLGVNIINSYIDNRKKDKCRVKKMSAGFIPE